MRLKHDYAQPNLTRREARAAESAVAASAVVPYTVAVAAGGATSLPASRD